MGGKWYVYDLMQCFYTLAVVDSIDADVEFYGAVHVCIHPAQANLCSSKARFVDASLPVLMQALGAQVMSENTVPNQVCCSLSGLLLFPAPPKVDTLSCSGCNRCRTYHIVAHARGRPATTRNQPQATYYEPGPIELCSRGHPTLAARAPPRVPLTSA